MYENLTGYDFELVKVSQLEHIKRTQILSVIFSLLLAIVGGGSIIMKQYVWGAIFLVAFVFVILTCVIFYKRNFLKLLSKQLTNVMIEINYKFEMDSVTISTNVIDKNVTQKNKRASKQTEKISYTDLYQIVEYRDIVKIKISKKENLILRKDDGFDSFKQNIKNVIDNKYVVKGDK